jgi:hypothetical protein
MQKAFLGLLLGCLLCGVILRSTHGDEPAQDRVIQTQQFTHEPPRNGTKPFSKAWDDVVGRDMVVEGIAWGSFEKGWGEYVILNGGKVYVSEAGFAKDPKQSVYGKLVRVRGTLTVRKLPPTPSTVAGTSSTASIFELANATWEAIDKVTWPWMREQTLVEQDKE